MKKVLWIINHYASKPEEGTGTRHYDIAQALIKSHIKIYIFAASYDHFLLVDRIPDDTTTYVREVIGEGAEIVWIKTRFKYSGNGIKRFLNMVSFFFAVLRVTRNIEKPDAIIGSSVHLFAPLAGYFLSKRYKCRFATEIRDIWPMTLVELGKISRWHPVVMLFSVIERFLYNRSDSIIATLPGFKQYCVSLGINRGVSIIPNGYAPPMNQQSVDASMIESIAVIHKEKFICLYSGSHGISNNLNVILDTAEIMKRNGNIAFVFIGDGPNKLELVERSQKSRLPNVFFFDRVDKATLAEVIRISDLTLVSMADSKLYKYGISLNKLNDYMYYEKPVIFAGNVKGNPVEISGCGMCIPPNDPASLAQAIQYIYELSVEDRLALGMLGKAFMMKERSMDAIAEKYIAIVKLDEQ